MHQVKSMLKICFSLFKHDIYDQEIINWAKKQELNSFKLGNKTINSKDL